MQEYAPVHEGHAAAFHVFSPKVGGFEATSEWAAGACLEMGFDAAVLKRTGRLNPRRVSPSKKGTGFVQPDRPHQH